MTTYPETMTRRSFAGQDRGSAPIPAAGPTEDGDP